MRAQGLWILFVSLGLAAAAAGCGADGGTTGRAGAFGAASTGTQASLSLGAPGTVAKGATFTAEVAFGFTVQNLYGAGFELRYDPAVVEYVSFDSAGSTFATSRERAAL